MLELLERFQTGIVGVVGFVGVIITLIVNDRLSRRSLHETREHDRDVLAKGLLAELSSSRRAIEKNIQQLRNVDPATHPGMIVPAHNATPVFDSNTARLGLLADDSVDSVLNAYLHLKEFDRSIVLFTKPDSSGLYRVLDTKNYAKAVASMLESLLPSLDVALTTLKSKPAKASSP